MSQKLNLLTSGIKSITLILLVLSFLVSPVYADESLEDEDSQNNVNTKTVSICYSTGQPKILSIVFPDFTSGDTSGLCELNVKNIGSATGTFIASISENEIFRQKYSSSKITFAPGESQIMRLYIYGTSTQDVTNVATFKVYDYNNPDAFDVLTSTISITEPKLCVPGTIRTTGLNVYECRADGSGEDIILSCSSGTVLIKDINDKWSCSEPLCSEGETIPGLKIISVVFLICLVSILFRRKK